MESSRKSPKEIKEGMLVNKLREVLGRLEIATMMSFDGMAWTDEGGRMAWCNSAFEDLIGQDRTELMGKPLVEILQLNDVNGAPLDDQAHPVSLVLTKRKHGMQVYEMQGVSPKVQLEVAFAPTSAADVQTSAVLIIRRLQNNHQFKATSTEIGDQLTALVEENTALAARVRNLESELAEAEQRAIDTLDAGYHTKTAFLGNMTHELRTPLSVIIGYADLLRRDLLSQGHFDWAKDVAQIRHASDQLSFMITELLDLAAIEEDQNEIHPMVFRVEKLLADVSNVAREYMVEQHNSLHVSISEDTPVEMMTDEAKLRKILLHLLSNAAKFTVHGKVSLNVDRGELNSEDAIVFEVVDSGIGMTNVQVGRIFEVFTQADESLTRSYEGGGIGLYLCHRFCQMLGGKITVESEPGVGSTFTVIFPVLLPADRL
ncbi:MAG: ATP-binding protein [Ardenticatenaceae bacterium]|nr:ATP-binding protein [Ardenticatenaceae bacterium]